MNGEALTPKNNGGSSMGSNNDQNSKIMARRRGSKGIAIIAESSDTKRQVAGRRQLMPRMGIKRQQPLPFQKATKLNFCCVRETKLVVWVLHLVDLIPLWELEPRHYQPPQMSMIQRVANLVDC